MVLSTQAYDSASKEHKHVGVRTASRVSRTPITKNNFVTHSHVIVVGIPVGTAVKGGDLEEQLGLEPQACMNVSCPP